MAGWGEGYNGGYEGEYGGYGGGFGGGYGEGREVGPYNGGSPYGGRGRQMGGGYGSPGRRQRSPPEYVNESRDAVDAAQRARKTAEEKAETVYKIAMSNAKIAFDKAVLEAQTHHNTEKMIQKGKKWKEDEAKHALKQKKMAAAREVKADEPAE